MFAPIYRAIEIISPLIVPEEEPDLINKMSALDDGHHDDMIDHTAVGGSVNTSGLHHHHRTSVSGVLSEGELNSAMESKNNSNMYNGGIEVGSGVDGISHGSNLDSMVGGGTATTPAASAKKREDDSAMNTGIRHSANNSQNSIPSLLDNHSTPRKHAPDRSSTDSNPSVSKRPLMSSAKSFKIPKVSFVPSTTTPKDKVIVPKKQTLDQRMKKLEKLEKMYAAYVSTKLSHDSSNNALELLEVMIMILTSINPLL